MSDLETRMSLAEKTLQDHDEKIKSVEQWNARQEKWINNHDGSINRAWSDQEKTNDRSERKIEKVEDAVSVLTDACIKLQTAHEDSMHRVGMLEERGRVRAEEERNDLKKIIGYVLGLIVAAVIGWIASRLGG